MDSRQHKFSENYMVLPKDVSFFKIFRVLWDDDIAFVECPTEKKENLDYRLRIFASLLSQKLLQSPGKTILSWLGSAFEDWPNLLSSYPNIFELLFNALRDKSKVEKPQKGSETYITAVGRLDKRVDLNKNIKPGDCRYYIALSAMAAKISYENRAFVRNVVRNHWKMELIEHNRFWNDFQKKHTTEAMMVHDKNEESDIIIVAFRGTEPFDTDAWCTDFDISWYELKGMGKVHGGFMKALGLLIDEGWPRETKQDESHPIAYYTIREKLKQILKQNDRTKFILTGHSLGGALAILFAAVLASHDEEYLLNRLEGVYTFGQPRVGDDEFKKFMEQQLATYGFKYWRFVYCNDVVPRCPSDDSAFLYKHFGTCIYFNSCYIGKILREAPHKNYLSAFAGIPRFLNAMWELIRSFIMPYMMGPEYAEGFFLKTFRCLGLIFPGVAAHGPQDYVNLSRLGSKSLYLQLQEQHSRSVSDLPITKN